MSSLRLHLTPSFGMGCLPLYPPLCFWSPRNFPFCQPGSNQGLSSKLPPPSPGPAPRIAGAPTECSLQAQPPSHASCPESFLSPLLFLLLQLEKVANLDQFLSSLCPQSPAEGFSRKNPSRFEDTHLKGPQSAGEAGDWIVSGSVEWGEGLSGCAGV